MIYFQVLLLTTLFVGLCVGLFKLEDGRDGSKLAFFIMALTLLFSILAILGVF